MTTKTTFIERLGLLFSDGSMGIGSEHTKIEAHREDALLADKHETHPDHFTKVVRVRVEVVEVVEIPTAGKLPAKTKGPCPTCGHVHAPAKAA